MVRVRGRVIGSRVKKIAEENDGQKIGFFIIGLFFGAIAATPAVCAAMCGLFFLPNEVE